MVLSLFISALIFDGSLLFTTANSTQSDDGISVAMIDYPDGGGYAYWYYGGTFGINDSSGNYLIGLHHLLYAKSDQTPITNGIKVYTTSFPNELSNLSISDQSINTTSKSAWVEASVYSTVGLKGTYYGLHRFTYSSSNWLKSY